MTSPQTRSRKNKIEMLKRIIVLTLDFLLLKKQELDLIDSRNIKKIVVEMEEWKSGKQTYHKK